MTDRIPSTHRPAARADSCRAGPGGQSEPAHPRGPTATLAQLRALAEASPEIRQARTLQRLADRQADANLPDPVYRAPPAATGQGGQAPIQRVGETKQIVTYKTPDQGHLAAYNEGKPLLETAVTDTRNARKVAKEKIFDEMTKDKAAKKIPKGGFTSAYAEPLKEHALATKLFEHPNFGAAEGKLYSVDKAPKKEIKYRKTKNNRAAIADLEPRSYTPLPKRPDEAARDVFTGDGTKGKEYVKDQRHVQTRRYAYVEKNYYQMMEFFGTNHMEGRFQSLMRAGTGAKRPNVRDPGSDSVRDYQKTGKGGDLSLTQLAFVHQALGSGPDQRGLSLTSTPRKGQTIGNTGENFRSDDGFMLKIDLARIPEGVNAPILLNHYARGGVKDNLGDVENSEVSRGNKGAYKFEDSVTKNRELYLEFLKPEYVVSIEYHPKSDLKDTGSQTFDRGDFKSQDLFLEAVKKASDYEKFKLGFDTALKREKLKKPSDAEPKCTKGFEAAEKYLKAYNDAKPQPVAPLPAKTTGAKPSAEPPPSNVNPFSDKGKYIYGDKSEKGYEPIGRIHALTGRKPIRSLSELGPGA